MIHEGAVVLVRFSTADGQPTKIRPAVIIRRLPGVHNDWLVAMVSSRLHQAIAGLDVVLLQTVEDFARTGLKTSSVVRVARLAVLNTQEILGSIGDVSPAVLKQLQENIASWIRGAIPKAG